ncbi:cyclin-dependent protein kinase inhibitor SMR6-like [Salvia divinorum]|uniref:Cyclin-dependent protein kinase inhibitor SMR6-like n=1 Tax=Salvia divinorum TaxID=28513 RepID=A0ABD1G5D7_SALDI
MGVPEKLRSIDSGAVDTENWVISAGIALRSSLKPVFTKPAEKTDDDEDFPTTPTCAESRMPARLLCPPPPKKRKPAPARSCHYGGVREFFNPPDLETIFIQRVEGA